MAFQALLWSLLQLQSRETGEVTLPQKLSQEILNRAFTWKESCAIHRWKTASCIMTNCQSWAWAFTGAISSIPLSLRRLKGKDADSHTHSQAAGEQDKPFMLCITDTHKWILRASEAPLQLGGGWLQVHQNWQYDLGGRYIKSFSAYPYSAYPSVKHLLYQYFGFGWSALFLSPLLFSWAHPSQHHFDTGIGIFSLVFHLAWLRCSASLPLWYSLATARLSLT